MDNKEKWLEINKFNAEGDTYIITGETYSIKDKLREAGFRYDPTLLWHGPDPAGYEDRCVKVNINEICEFGFDGNAHFLLDAKNIINKKVANDLVYESSEWVGEPGERLKDTEVTLVKKACFMGKFGLTNVYTFQDLDGNIYTWFTTTSLVKEVKDVFKIRATIKKHDEYKGTKTTVLTRCRVIE